MSDRIVVNPLIDELRTQANARKFDYPSMRKLLNQAASKIYDLEATVQDLEEENANLEMAANSFLG